MSNPIPSWKAEDAWWKPGAVAGKSHPGQQFGDTHWGQSMCQLWITAPTAPPHHKNSGRSPGWQFLTQGAAAATGGLASGTPRHGPVCIHTDLVYAVSHSTGLLSGQLVWPQGQHPEVPQSPLQSRSPPWHCWPPLLPQLLVQSSPHMVPSLWTPQQFLRESLAPIALLPGQQLC